MISDKTFIKTKTKGKLSMSMSFRFRFFGKNFFNLKKFLVDRV